MSDMKVVNEVEIYALPERVFYWLEKPERAKQWMTSVTRTEYIKKTPNIIGTRFREFVEENGHGIEMKGIVTEFKPNKIFAVNLESEMHSADVRFVLTAARGKTQLTQSIELHFKNELNEAVLDSIKRNVVNQAKSEFARLKELCEQDF